MRNYQYKAMHQNAMQFTATQIRSEEEEARICLKIATVTATTTTVSSTAPFLPFHYGPHPPPPPLTQISTVSFPTAINPSRWCLNLAVLCCCCAYSQKKEILFSIWPIFQTFFSIFFIKKSSENEFLSVPGCNFFYFLIYLFIFLRVFFSHKNSPLLHNWIAGKKKHSHTHKGKRAHLQNNFYFIF